MKRTAVLMAVMCLVALAATGEARSENREARAQSDAANRQSAVVGHRSSVVGGAEAIAIPQLLSYQGRLTDTLGVPVADTLYAIRFRLYAVPSGGTQFWEETQDVRTKGGLFSVLLGSVTPIGTVPDAGTLYLGMAVGGGAELTPRLRIGSAAYAYKADTANYALAGAGGGDNAWVRGTPDSVLYTVRRLGVARGAASNMLYGTYRQSHTNLGVSCTTGTSGLDNANIVVAGGFGNRARAALSSIGGGTLNLAAGAGGTVAGGAGNVAGDSVTDTCATVAGGYGNFATGMFATVGGGQNDTASGPHATVSGGMRNRASGGSATVGGGSVNRSGGGYATVAGGTNNEASGFGATVAGGRQNAAETSYATVGGGYQNTASAAYATVPGGGFNDARGSYSLAAGRFARANHRGSFVWSDSAVSVSESVYTSGNNQFRARARGGTWFFSNAGMTTGAYLASGSNSWESACDSMTKEDFRPVDRKTLLDKVAALRVRDYKMKDQNDGTRHIGPVAQDFHNAFGYGGNETSINMADADGVLMAAVQALYERLEAQQAEIEALKAELRRR